MKSTSADINNSEPTFANSGKKTSRKVFWICLLTTSALWQIYFQPAGVWPLGFVLLSPFAVAACLSKMTKRSFFAFWAAGMACWLAGIYWMSWVTPPGWIGLAFYMGFYWPLAAVLLKRCRACGLNMTISLPLVWVPLELMRGWLFSGFPWFFMAHGLAEQAHFIQSADIFGAFGPSFLIVMVNGLVADFLLWRMGHSGAKRPIIAATITILLLGANIGYGVFRVNQRDEHISRGPRITAVQSAFPVSLYIDRVAQGGEIFAGLLENSPVNAKSDIDLLIWPETVLPPVFQGPIPSAATGGTQRNWTSFNPADFNPEMRAFITERAEMHKSLSELLQSQDKKITLLAGGTTFGVDDAGEFTGALNSALIIKASEGAGSDLLDFGSVYSKIHCVPFGEYLPFRQSVPFLYRFLRMFVPDQMDQLRRGTERINFELDSAGGKKWRIAQCICYEGVIDRMCRRLIWQGKLPNERDLAAGEKARADVLVNLSNDGWFVWPFGGVNWPSGELDQHMAVYAFRAVENRVPVVRAVNTGISCHIDSAGRLVDILTVDGRAKMVKGFVTADVEIDNRETFYGRFGNVFAICISCMLIIVLIAPKFRRHSGPAPEKVPNKNGVL